MAHTIKEQNVVCVCVFLLVHLYTHQNIYSSMNRICSNMNRKTLQENENLFEMITFFFLHFESTILKVTWMLVKSTSFGLENVEELFYLQKWIGSYESVYHLMKWFTHHLPRACEMGGQLKVIVHMSHTFNFMGLLSKNLWWQAI